MNCPHCNQPVGPDQYGFGRSLARFENGVFVEDLRQLTVECDHCGLFDVRLGKGNYVYSSVVLSDPVSIARARTRLPNTTRERITHIDSDCQLTPA